MHVDEQQVLSVSKDLWTSVLGLQIRHADHEPRAKAKEKTWSSCITVSGTWHGAIVLECPESIARHAAAMLFSSDGESASPEEIEDALNELTDMVGKRIRALLPESIKLSRPSIVSEDEHDKALSGLRDLRELHLSCEGRPVRIAFLEGEPDAVAAD